LCFVSSSTATRIQLNFLSNLLRIYASRLKQISSEHQYRCTKWNIDCNDNTQTISSSTSLTLMAR